MRTPSPRDIHLFEAINRRWTNAFLDWFMPRVTHMGLGGVQLPMVAAAWWWQRAAGGDQLLWSALLAFLLSTGFVHLIKRRVKRLRPVRYTDVRFLVPRTEHGSFPSGHTATTFALATVVGWFFPLCAAPLLALAAVIGYSRVYVGVHFLSDVTVAAAIGVASGLICLLPAMVPA